MTLQEVTGLAELPLVSVVVITYNSAGCVAETLESIKAQTYSNIELIISDDCSADETLNVCNEWINLNRPRFSKVELVLSDRNTGISANSNRGIKIARGEWIKLIAGDDALEPEVLKIYIDYISDHQSIKMIHSNVLKYNNSFDEYNLIERTDLKHLKINRPETSPEEQYQILLRSGPVMTATTLVRKDVYDDVGLYDEKSLYWEDTPMWLKITKSGVSLHFLDIVGAKYRVHEESVQKLKNGSQLFSSFKLSKDIYFKNNYLKELPVFERMIRAFIIYRNIFFLKITNNKRSFLTRSFIYATGLLPDWLLSQLEMRYFK